MLKLIKSSIQGRVMDLQWVKPEDSTQVTSSTVLLKVTKPFSSSKDGVTRYQNTLDPNHLEYITIPTAQQIFDGKVFSVNSNTLGLTTFTQGYESFRDGVIDIDIHVGAQDVSVTGTKGKNYLIGTGLEPILQTYDSVIIGKEVYLLDKTKPTNAGTVLYLDKDLTEDVTLVTVATRDNLKVRNNFRTKCGFAKIASILTDRNYYRATQEAKKDAVMKVLKNDVASKIFFEQESYLESDRLLRENVEILKYLGLLD